MFDRKEYQRQYRLKNKAKAKKYRIEHKDELKFSSEEWYRRHKGYNKKWRAKNKGYMKKWRAKNKDACRRYSQKTWLTKHRLTEELYQKMSSEQKDCCAICAAHKDNVSRGLHIDHDHKTGKVRGLLCMNCNTAIGKFRDDTLLLERALDYVKRHK